MIIMKRWGIVIGLLFFLWITGCTLHQNVPVVDIRTDPPLIFKKIPLKVAILIPDKMENYTYDVQHIHRANTIETTYPLGKLLKKISLEIFPHIFDEVVLIKGGPYSTDIDAVIIPNFEKFKPDFADPSSLGTFKFTANVSISLSLVDRTGLSLWSRTLSSSSTEKKCKWGIITQVVENCPPEMGSGTYEAISEALKKRLHK